MRMNRGLVGACAAALVALLPLPAAAQAVEATYRAPLNPPTPPLGVELYTPGDTMPAFPASTIPSFRPSLTIVETEEDRAHRLEETSKCFLLGEIAGRSGLDVIAGLPHVLVDWVATGFRPGVARDDTCSLRSAEERSLLPRLLSIPADDPAAHPFDDLVNQLLAREQRYFSRFQDSDLATFGLEAGTEDIDFEELMEDQQKLWFDVVRKLYLGRFGRSVDDRFRDEAIDVGRWQPVDFVVAPALVAGYLYVRGWEKKIEIGGVKCAFQMESLRRIIERFEGGRNDLVSAASLELGVGTFPIKVILSVGIQDGDALLDFVGIGTSIGKAKQVVSQELDFVKDEN